MLPDGAKISCRGKSSLRGTIDIVIDQDTGKAQEILIEFDEQTIPITYDPEKGKNGSQITQRLLSEGTSPSSLTWSGVSLLRVPA